jgi:polysaccharide biosynthesis protein PslH
MRVLLLTPFVPSADAGHGGGAYLAVLTQALASRAELGLVTLAQPDELADASHRGPFQFVAGAPPPSHGPEGRTLRQRGRTLWQWTQRPLVAAKTWQPELLPVLAKARREFRPDVVLVEMAQMAQYLDALTGVPTVLTDHEGGCPANTRTGLGWLGDRRDRRLWWRYVARHYPKANLLQTLTQEDAAALGERLQRPVAVRPPAVELPAAPATPAAQPPRALFLGDYRHGPNPEAATRIAQRIWPAVRAAVPAAELWLVGPHEATIRPLATLAGVKVLGFAPNLAALLGSVRVLLAPLWSGGGFRVKLATALAHGIPVVTNRLGARGCAAPAPALHQFEAEDDLAAAVVPLLREPVTAAAAGAAAHRFARQHLTADAVADLQIAELEGLLRRR